MHYISYNIIYIWANFFFYRFSSIFPFSFYFFDKFYKWSWTNQLAYWLIIMALIKINSTRERDSIKQLTNETDFINTTNNNANTVSQSLNKFNRNKRNTNDKSYSYLFNRNGKNYSQHKYSTSSVRSKCSIVNFTNLEKIVKWLCKPIQQMRASAK